MNCKSIQKKIQGKHSSELSTGENELIQNHILSCPGCREYLKKSKETEDYLLALSKSMPIPVNDDLMADSIISAINTQKKSLYPNSFIVDFFNWIQKDIVRYAFIAILFLISGYYCYQEYYTVKKLYALEKHLSQISINDVNAAVIPIQLTNGVSWIYDLYKYLNGSNYYWEIRENTIVINKSNLKKLFMDFNKLSYDEQNEIINLKKQLFPELLEQQVAEKGSLIINNTNLEKKLKSLNSAGGSHEK
jgi:hypothetical protein